MPTPASIQRDLHQTWEDLRGLWLWFGVPGASRLALVTLPVQTRNGTDQYGLAFSGLYPDDDPYPLTGFENIGPAVAALRALRIALHSGRVAASGRRP